MRLVSILILLSSCNLFANIIVFADKNLENAICKELKIQPPVTTENIRKLTDLTSTNSHIKKLDGLEFAKNLSILYLGSNEITDLSPLSALSNLEKLDLNHNGIIDINSLVNLKKLQMLNLGENKVSDISAIKDLTNLVYLDLNENQLTDINSLANLINLERLDLRENKITVITALSKMAKLDNLILDRNKISDISPLVSLTNLTMLMLQENEISDLRPLTNLTELDMLYLNQNRIKDVTPLIQLPKLHHLLIERNPLDDKAYTVWFPQMEQNNSEVFISCDRNLHPIISTSLFHWVLLITGGIGVLGVTLLRMRWRECKYPTGEEVGQIGKSALKAALESVGFAIASALLLAIAVFFVWVVDAYPTGQMGGFSLMVQAFLTETFAFFTSVTAIVFGVIAARRAWRERIMAKTACLIAIPLIISICTAIGAVVLKIHMK